MLRRTLILFVSILVGTSSMAGVTRAFDHRTPSPPIHNIGPIVELEPVIMMSYAIRSGERPCPTESHVAWPAEPPRWDGRPRPSPPTPEAAAWSPVYCVWIDRSGQVLSVRLAAGSGDAEVDRRLAQRLRAMRFTPAGWHDPVTAWHRVVVSLSGRPEGFDGTPHQGPELLLHFVG